MKALVTGGYGFIGSHIVERLLSEGYEVVVFDNLSTGQIHFLDTVKGKFKFVLGDLLDFKLISNALKGVDIVFHLAANADIKNNLLYPTKCLEQNTIATSNLLEAMRNNNVKKIMFASTGSVYGEPNNFPTKEDECFPVQTSLYAASKLACEGLLEAYANGYGFQVYIFRFVSIMGERYSHGCIFDFYKKLKKDNSKLNLLGNGKQTKSYLYVKDCVEAIMTIVNQSKERINIFNLGNKETINVEEIAKIVIKELGFSGTKIITEKAIRGWVGDSPKIELDISKIAKLGWSPEVSITGCIIKTVQWIKLNDWITDERD